MHQHDRISIIHEILNSDGKVYINDLSERFGISKVTIRKDLDGICESGIAIRFHGGAELAKSNINMHLAVNTQNQDDSAIYEIRKSIAVTAAQQVYDGDSIFLGSGMTCSLLAKELRNVKDLTVITNNISALPDLLSYAKNVVVIGGNIISVDNSTYFSWTEDPFQYMRSFFVNKAFTSCFGVDIQAGLTVASVVSTYVYKCIPDIKREWFLLVDHDKFNKIGLYVLNSLNSINCVISDYIPENYQQYLAENKISYLLAQHPDQK